MPTKTKRLVIDGKVIPQYVLELLDRVNECMRDEPEEAKTILDVNMQHLYDIQACVFESDIITRLKTVAVTAVEVISEMNDNDDMSYKELTEAQIEVMHALDDVRALMSTLAIHRFAEAWGTDLPDDFRVDRDGKPWSNEFEDADDE